MSRNFKDVQHLLHMAGLFVLGLAGFVVLRAILVPAGFGELGHFRSGALADNRQRPLAFAGRDACAECHDDVVRARQGGKHAGIGCEACHGALAAHAADAEHVRPTRPDARTICLVCHLANVAKPASFPQIVPAEHGEGEACTSCHRPHHPKAE